MEANEIMNNFNVHKSERRTSPPPDIQDSKIQTIGLITLYVQTRELGRLVGTSPGTSPGCANDDVLEIYHSGSGLQYI